MKNLKKFDSISESEGLNEEERFGGEISYIESVIMSKEYESMAPDQQIKKLKEVLDKKFSEVYDDGIKRGENNIKRQIKDIKYTE